LRQAISEKKEDAVRSSFDPLATKRLPARWSCAEPASSSLTEVALIGHAPCSCPMTPIELKKPHRMQEAILSPPIPIDECIAANRRLIALTGPLQQRRIEFPEPLNLHPRPRMIPPFVARRVGSKDWSMRRLRARLCATVLAACRVSSRWLAGVSDPTCMLKYTRKASSYSDAVRLQDLHAGTVTAWVKDPPYELHSPFCLYRHTPRCAYAHPPPELIRHDGRNQWI
jgi:hypothetical protein